MARQDPFELKRSLFLITDPDLTTREATDRALAGIHGGATHVVVRRPHDVPAKVFESATALSIHSGEGARWRVLVHDRVDIAVATFAQGAVLRLNGIPGGPAKSMLLGEERMMGISVHTIGQARSAQLQYADFLIFGNVYETESHPGKPGAGLEALAGIVKDSHVPVIAIGGITPGRVDEVLATGASGVAVIRAISRAPDPEAAAREFRQALAAAPYPHLSTKETS
jgi:thiamine-phosphate diphosphorylase